MTTRAAPRPRPLAAAAWFFGAAWIAAGLTHHLIARAAGVEAFGSVVALTAGFFALVLACVGAVRMLSGRPGRRAMARILGLPLRDFAFSAAFAAVVAPTLWLSL